jgi:hypothetical protein
MGQWHPPIPAGKLYSEDALRLGPGIALLAWCYDNVGRDGTIEVHLEEVAVTIGKPYGTIRGWWRLLREGPFFRKQTDKGKQGWIVWLADDWLDWRVMKNNYPDTVNAEMSALSKRRDVSAENGEHTVNAPSKFGERRDFSAEKNVYGTHDSQNPDLTNGGYGMSLDYGAAAAAASGEGEKTPGPTGGRPPPPPHSAPSPAPSLPAAIERAGRDWLKSGAQLGQAERKRLLALLGTYGADWLQLGIAAAVDQGGRTLNYLEVMLQGCKQDGRPPGSPKENAHDRHTNNRGGGAQTHQRGRFAVPAQPELTPEQIAELRNAPKLIDVMPDLLDRLPPARRRPPDDHSRGGGG